MILSDIPWLSVGDVGDSGLLSPEFFSITISLVVAVVYINSWIVISQACILRSIDYVDVHLKKKRKKQVQ